MGYVILAIYLLIGGYFAIVVFLRDFWWMDKQGYTKRVSLEGILECLVLWIGWPVIVVYAITHKGK